MKAPRSAAAKRRASVPQAVSPLEEKLWLHLRVLGLDVGCEREHRFSSRHGYRLDFAWPAFRLGAEAQGGIWSRGAHGRPQGIERDIRKAQVALANGWRVLPFTAKDIDSGRAADALAYMLAAEGVRGRESETTPAIERASAWIIST